MFTRSVWSCSACANDWQQEISTGAQADANFAHSGTQGCCTPKHVALRSSSLRDCGCGVLDSTLAPLVCFMSCR